MNSDLLKRCREALLKAQEYRIYGVSDLEVAVLSDLDAAIAQQADHGYPPLQTLAAELREVAAQSGLSFGQTEKLHGVADDLERLAQQAEPAAHRVDWPADAHFKGFGRRFFGIDEGGTMCRQVANARVAGIEAVVVPLYASPQPPAAPRDQGCAYPLYQSPAAQPTDVWLHHYRKISGGGHYTRPNHGEAYQYPDPEPGYEWTHSTPLYEHPPAIIPMPPGLQRHNAGVQCDALIGACACGAWHKDAEGAEPIAPTMAEQEDGQRHIWHNEDGCWYSPDAVRELIDADRAARAARAEQDVAKLMRLVDAVAFPTAVQMHQEMSVRIAAIEAHARRMMGL